MMKSMFQCGEEITLHKTGSEKAIWNAKTGSEKSMQMKLHAIFANTKFPTE